MKIPSLKEVVSAEEWALRVDLAAAYRLVAAYGWPELDARLRMNCFADNPSIKSALTFLRRTPWARTKVEELYIKARSAEVQGRPRP